jgi:hypothetical protein
MPKLILISLIPLVTIGGRSQPVVANHFDDSGNFGQRNGSFKRPRVEGGGAAARDGYFDLARDAVAPSLPNIPKLDLNKIRGLLVKANETAETIRTRIAADSGADGARDLAGLSIALLDLLNAVVEEGIIPMASPTAASFASVVAGSAATSQTTVRPRQEPGTAELKAALVAAEKTAVVFDADLGRLPAANRGALNGAFAAGLKAATMKVADESGGDAVECIRIVNDALSCVDNMDFVGQSSERKIDKRDPANPITFPYCTMPVKLDFPDRNTRIHFERTLRKHCGMKASMSLPFQIRKYQGLFYKAMKARYPDRIVMVRPDTPSLSFVAFVKNEGGSGWTRCRETVPIPKGIMLPSYVFPNRVDLPTVADDEMGIGDDDALLVEASIGAESQSQS